MCFNIEYPQGISKQYGDSVVEFCDNLIKSISKICRDAGFKKFLLQNEKINELKSLSRALGNEDDRFDVILLLFQSDVLRCFSFVSDISNKKSREIFAIDYLCSVIFDSNNLDLAKELYDHAQVELAASEYRINKHILNKLVPSNKSYFFLSYFLDGYNNGLKKDYLNKLYQFATLSINADKNSGMNNNSLDRIFNGITNKNLVEKAEKNILSISFDWINENSLEEILEELNGLIGLNQVKNEVHSLVNFIKVQKAREAAGLKTSSISYHCVFNGNPGTGKTTVARIVAKIFKYLGIISQGQLVETDRSGLIGEYLGQTAVKVNKVIDTAINGVLFIDEAYSLIGENKDDFGKEAVATLIKRMEDDRDKLVIIIAGYTNEMKTFIDTNPGFKSRFNRYIEFADYSPEELLSIFKLQCSQQDYMLNSDAEIKLMELFKREWNDRDRTFGNGRLARNIFEKTLEDQANRISNIASLDQNILTTITREDIPEFA